MKCRLRKRLEKRMWLLSVWEDTRAEAVIAKDDGSQDRYGSVSIGTCFMLLMVLHPHSGASCSWWCFMLRRWFTHMLHARYWFL